VTTTAGIDRLPIRSHQRGAYALVARDTSRQRRGLARRQGEGTLPPPKFPQSISSREIDPRGESPQQRREGRYRSLIYRLTAILGEIRARYSRAQVADPLDDGSRNAYSGTRTIRRRNDGTLKLSRGSSHNETAIRGRISAHAERNNARCRSALVIYRLAVLLARAKRPSSLLYTYLHRGASERFVEIGRAKNGMHAPVRSTSLPLRRLSRVRDYFYRENTARLLPYLLYLQTISRQLGDWSASTRDDTSFDLIHRI